MDRLATYRALLKELISQHAERINRHPQSNTEQEHTRTPPAPHPPHDQQGNQNPYPKIGNLTSVR